jgi:hypothetical protein
MGATGAPALDPDGAAQVLLQAGLGGAVLREAAAAGPDGMGLLAGWLAQVLAAQGDAAWVRMRAVGPDGRRYVLTVERDVSEQTSPMLT